MRSAPSLKSFPNVVFHGFDYGSNVRLTDDGPLSSFQGRSSSASSVHASLLQAIDDVMSLALCLPVVSQAPQHFRSSEKQATCEGCFARQSICSVISLHSGMCVYSLCRHRVAIQFMQTAHCQTIKIQFMQTPYCQTIKIQFMQTPYCQTIKIQFMQTPYCQTVYVVTVLPDSLCRPRTAGQLR